MRILILNFFLFFFFFFFNDTATTEIYTVMNTLSLQTLFRSWPRSFQALEIGDERRDIGVGERSEEHTSELQSLITISYAVFCLKKKKKKLNKNNSSPFSIKCSPKKKKN